MQYDGGMRTTLDIDPDILGIAKELAAQRRVSAGKVLSDLAREALKPKEAPKYRNGVPLLRPRPGSLPATMELVNRIRDEE